jgi:hypothetical protein
MNRRIVSSGNDRDDLRRVVQTLNFSEYIVPVTAIGSPETLAAATAHYGGVAVDRDVFRRLLPDDRWLVYAAGEVEPPAAGTATLALVYDTGDHTGGVATPGATVLGAIAAIGPGGVNRKVLLGPFDVFTPLGTQAPTERIPIVRLRCVSTAASTILQAWTIWLRLTPGKQ